MYKMGFLSIKNLRAAKFYCMISRKIYAESNRCYNRNWNTSFMKSYRYAKKLINTGIFTVFLLFIIRLDSALSETFTSEKDKFSLEYDDTMAPADVKLYNVALALKRKNAKFPTFNVVIESGGIDLYAPKEEKEKSVLDSYRLVGITDVSLISSGDRNINGQACFNAELSYSLEGLKLRSNVGIFSAFDRHYILTFIDQEENYTSSQDIARKILASFKMLGGRNETLPGPKNWDFAGLLLAILASFMVAAVISLKYLRRQVPSQS
jgi:hypothetical protein